MQKTSKCFSPSQGPDSDSGRAHIYPVQCPNRMQSWGTIWAYATQIYPHQFSNHFQWLGLMHDGAANESCLSHLQVSHPSSSSAMPSWRCDWSFAWRCHAPDTIDYDQHMLSLMICMFQRTLRNQSNLELLLHNVLENLQSCMPVVENCQWMDWSVGSVLNTMWTDHVIGKTNITKLGNCSWYSHHDPNAETMWYRLSH
jgi:hypothetical protein